MSSSDDFCEEVYYIQPSAASQNAKGQENRLQHSGDCHTESTESNPGKDDAPPPLLTMRTTVNKDNGRESTQGNQVGCLTSRGEVASLDLSHEAILEHDRNNEDHQHQGGSPTTINSSVDTTNNTAALVNPFASFTYCEDKVSALMVGVPPARKIGHCSGVGQRKKLLEIQMKPVKGAAGPQTTRKEKRKRCAKGEDISGMSQGELRALRAKWRRMADPAANAEDQRFQVLVALLLCSHAHAHVVSDGVEKLKKREHGLTAKAMAAIDQEDLAQILRSVHWNKAKSKHVRESAATILRRHGGVVPRRKGDLLALPGVGPALGEILCMVFDSWEADDAATSSD
ncbi:unnamed protein product [Ascophyllum nodosum]